jgi:hypothetical protein
MARAKSRGRRERQRWEKGNGMSVTSKCFNSCLPWKPVAGNAGWFHRRDRRERRERRESGEKARRQTAQLARSSRPGDLQRSPEGPFLNMGRSQRARKGGGGDRRLALLCQLRALTGKRMRGGHSWPPRGGQECPPRCPLSLGREVDKVALGTAVRGMTKNRNPKRRRTAKPSTQRTQRKMEIG